MPTAAAGGHGRPPDPSGVRTYDSLAERLRALRAWSGMSFRQLHRQVLAYRSARGIAEMPSLDAVHRCMQSGRSRMDIDLVVDIARVLLGEHGNVTDWAQAAQVAAGHASERSVVTVWEGLPTETTGFVGREAALTQVVSILEAATTGPSCTASTVVIEGMAGVGKTRLAMRAAHQLVERVRFDRVLWVNLRGYDNERPPADPSAVLEGFLRLLGLRSHEVAGMDLDTRSRRFRALLNGQRTLIVLDNAADDAQLLPLLPATSNCVAIVTTRRRTEQLAGATYLPLGVLDATESAQVLAELVGGERTSAEPDAAAEIAAVLGHLPLALCLVGSWIRTVDQWSLGDQLERLRDRHHQLRLESGVDLAMAASYESLSPPAQDLLRRLSLHPGNDFDLYAAAAVADAQRMQVEEVVEELVAANLLERRGDGRFEFHDLVHVFAANRSIDEEPKSVRRAAILRLADYYHYTARLAVATVEGSIASHPRTWQDLPTTPTPRFVDPPQAQDWLESECVNLFAAAATAAEEGERSYLADLSETLFPYLESGVHFTSIETMPAAHDRSAVRAQDSRALLSFSGAWEIGR